MFTTLTNWLKTSPAAAKKSARARLHLEGMEGRVVPAVYTWTDGGATNNWDDAGNWSVAAGNPTVPTSGQAGGTVVTIPLNDASMFQNIPNLVIDKLEFTNAGSALLTLSQPLSVTGNFFTNNIVNAGGANSILGSGANELILTSATTPFFQVAAGELVVSATISGTKDLVLNAGGGVLELTRDNTYTGSTRVNQGILRLNSPVGGGHAIPDGTSLAVGNGDTNAAEAYVQLAAASQLASSTAITVKQDGVFTQINGSNNVIGDINYLGGTVSVGSGNLAVQHIHAQDNMTIAAAAGGQVTLLNGQHTIEVDAGKVLTITAPIVNAGGGAVGGIVKTGAGELYFNNQTAGSPNSYTGETVVQDGTLRLNDVAANSAFLGDLTVGDGTGAAGSAVVVLGANSEIPNAAAVTVRSDGKLDLNGKSETVGALALSGGAQVVTGTGVLTLNGDVTVFAGVTTPATVTGDLALGAGDRVVTVFNGTPATDFVIDGVISGGNLVKKGPGALEIKGQAGTPNAHGTTSVHDGVLILNDNGISEAIPGSLFIGDGTGAAGSAVVRFAQGGEIADAVGVAVLADGKLDLNGFSDTIGALVVAGGQVATGLGTLTLGNDVTVSASAVASTVSGKLNLGGATRTFGGPGELSVSAVVSNGGVTKTGAGRLILSGNNTYAGPTALSAGELWVHGQQPNSDVTLTAGTLNVTGAVGKLTATGGTVSPGLTEDAQPQTKSFALGAGTYVADLYGPNQGDRIDATGTVTLTGGTLDANRVFGQTIGTPPAPGQAFTIIANDGADAVVGTFAGLHEGATFAADGRTFQITYAGGDGNDVVLTDVTPNTPPTISDVADQTDPQGAIPFTVNDAETPAANLQASASSSNTTLFPAGSVVVGGSGASRTVTLTPAAGQSGTATITLTVTDANGGTATDTFVVTVSAPPPAQQPDPFAVGGGAGAGSIVKVFNADGSAKATLQAFEAGFSGGVRTATADVNGDGTPDTIVGAGPGRVAEVRVFDGKTGQQILSNTPFADFTGGVFVAAGDFNADGFADIVITPDEGGGPRVTIVSGKNGAIVSNFFAIDDANFRGGARAAVGDVNGDGSPDLVVSAGFGGGPRIAVFDGKTLGGTPTKLVNDFFAFEPALRNGAYVAVGDLNGDGKDDMIFGGGPGGGPRVLALDSAKALQGDTTGVLANFFAGNVDNRGGVRVVAKNLDNDAKADIVVGDGAGAGSRVTTYLGKDLGTAASSFDAFPGFLGGVFVG